jgi:hypothetical protein
VPKSCQLSAVLMPAAGAHCNITDICLARAVSAPAFAFPAFFLSEEGDRHAQPHRGSVIKGAMAGAVGEAAAGNPRNAPSENQFRESAKLAMDFWAKRARQPPR